MLNIFVYVHNIWTFLPALSYLWDLWVLCLCLGFLKFRHWFCLSYFWKFKVLISPFLSHHSIATITCFFGKPTIDNESRIFSCEFFHNLINFSMKAIFLTFLLLLPLLFHFHNLCMSFSLLDHILSSKFLDPDCRSIDLLVYFRFYHAP